jgi:hypothetical protein
MDFEQKYNKYKQKYLELKKMKAGLRFVPAGPMIGYPTVPIMPPQVRVTGPIPQPAVISPVISPVMSPVFPVRAISPVRSISPFSPFLPIPFPLIRPLRVIRFTSSDDKKTTSPPRFRINLSINDTAQLKKINDTIDRFNATTSGKKSDVSHFTSLELYSTTDEENYDAILKKLKSISPITITFDKVEVDGDIIKAFFTNSTITGIIPKDIKIEIPLFNANNSTDASSILGSLKASINTSLSGNFNIEIK